MVRIQAVTVWLVLLLVSWIVDQKHLRGRGAADDDAVHGVCLMLRTLDVAVLLMVEKRPER
jgi:hypothetical protein